MASGRKKISILVVFAIVFLQLLMVTSAYYPKSFYNSDKNDEEIELDDDDADLDNDDDYPADQPYRPKRPLDIDQLQDFLYNVKTNVLDDSHSDISTLKNRDYFSNNKFLKAQTKKLKPVAASLSATTAKNSKITDWLDMDGIQSDQPSPSPSSSDASGTSVVNHTANPIGSPSAKQVVITENPPPYESANNNQSTPEIYDARPSRPVPYYPPPRSSADRRPVQPNYQSGSGYYPSSRFQEQYPPYPSGSVSSWSCHFTPYNNCSIQNDPLTGPLFQLQNIQQQLYRQQPSWNLVMNTSSIPISKVGGRLITPYIPTNKASKGCLTIHYLTTGDEIQKVTVYQQDTENRCLWSTSNYHHSGYQQQLSIDDKQIQLTVDLQPGSDPRFFIEVYMKNVQPRRGIFALSSLDMSYQPCLRDQRNFCSTSPPLGSAGGGSAAIQPVAKRESDYDFEP